MIRKWKQFLKFFKLNLILLITHTSGEVHQLIIINVGIPVVLRYGNRQVGFDYQLYHIPSIRRRADRWWRQALSQHPGKYWKHFSRYSL